MSHGKRMLKAQARREQSGNGSDDDDRGTLGGSGGGRASASLAYLRSNRAFDADGTPNRPSRRRGPAEDGSGEEEEHHVLQQPQQPQQQRPSLTHAPKAEGTAAEVVERREHKQRERRSRSRTPPAQMLLTGARNVSRSVTAGLSPQSFVPPGLRSGGSSPPNRKGSSGRGSGAMGTEPAAGRESGKESRATPRRRTTRNYPIERVSAALSSVTPERAPTRSPGGAEQLAPPPPSVQLGQGGGRGAAGAVGNDGDVVEEEEGVDSAALSLGNATASRTDKGTSNNVAHTGDHHIAGGGSEDNSDDATLHRPPPLPPLAPGGSTSHGSGGRLPRSARVTPGSASAGARLPMPSPPLRAVVSPRMEPQHLSRVNSTASQSRGGFPSVSRHSTPTTTTSVAVGLGGESDAASQPPLHRSQPPQRVSPMGSPGWALPAPAFGRADEHLQVIGDEDASSAQQQQRAGEGWPVARPPSFPSAPPTQHFSDVSGDEEREGGESSPVICTNSGSGELVTEVQPHPSSSPSAVVGPQESWSHSGHPAGVPGPRAPGPPPAVDRPPPPTGDTPSRAPLVAPDHSGFHNRGNDCYACSVLTLLLRSQLFRRALGSSPVAIATRAFYASRPPRVSSGYAPDAPLYAPSRRGGRFHRFASLSPTTSEDDEDTEDEEDEEGTQRRRPRSPPRDQDLLPLDAEGELEPSVHGRLEDLLGEVWRRERLMYRVNDNTSESEESRWLLFHKYMRHCLGKRSEGMQPYQYGIDLRPFAHLFLDDFFTGEQEDAHELFVSIIARLEQEAEQLERRRLDAAAPGDNGPDRKRCRPEGEGAAPRGSEQSPPLPPVWVNRLMQGKLLNIVRCCNPECQHHIATEEAYVNLTVTIAKQTDKSAGRDTHDDGTGAYADADADADAEEDEAPRISQLLFQSLQYGKLDDYVCDACGSKTRQFQGACFYTEPPPLLVIQLKRFAIQAGLNASGVFEVNMTKDRSQVHVEDLLEVYSLPETDFAARQRYHDKNTSQLGQCIVEAEQHATTTTVHARGWRKGDVTREGEEGEGPMIDAVRTVYQLRGTVLHLGRRLTFGHYVSQFAVVCGPPPPLAKNTAAGPHERRTMGAPYPSWDKPFPSLEEVRQSLPPLRWRVADDAVVRKLDTAAVQEQRRHCDQSYLLLYEKVCEERVRVPVGKVLPVLGDTGTDSGGDSRAETEDGDGGRDGAPSRTSDR